MKQGRKAERLGPCRKDKELTVRKTDKQAEMREKALPACAQRHAHTNNRGDLLPLFVCMFILHLYPFIPPPTGSLIVLRSLLSFCLPSPTPPCFYAFSSLSCTSLQYIVPGGDSSKSNCLSISHQYTASRGSCPLKTMKVGLSAEPGIRFNYINKEFCLKKKKPTSLLHFHEKPSNISAVKSLNKDLSLTAAPIYKHRQACTKLLGSIFLAT